MESAHSCDGFQGRCYLKPLSFMEIQIFEKIIYNGSKNWQKLGNKQNPTNFGILVYTLVKLLHSCPTKITQKKMAKNAVLIVQPPHFESLPFPRTQGPSRPALPVWRNDQKNHRLKKCRIQRGEICVFPANQSQPPGKDPWLLNHSHH